jgi:hypothetical protein
MEETSYGSATNSQLRIVKVANILTATASDFQSFDVTVPTYTTNPVIDAAHPWNSGDMNANAPQLGSTDQMQTNDTRILSAAWRRDAQGVEHLVASQDVGATVARALWYEFFTSTPSPTLNQSGDVGAPGASSYFPSIDIAPNGNIGVNFLESSSSEYMSMYVTGRTISDPLNTTQTPTLVMAGQASYTMLGGFLESSPHRAGDYSGIGVDFDSSGNPLNTFWAANEYTDPNGVWATVLMSFSVSPSNPLSPIAVSAIAAPNPVTSGTTTVLSASATEPNAGATITSYAWSVQSSPSGATFAGGNTGSSVTAQFAQAGTYTFLVNVADSLGATGSNTVTLTVQQALTSITVSPPTTTVADGGSKQFTATAFDQFGKAMTTQPSFTWTIDSPAGGTISSSSGLYTAPNTGHGTDAVRASAGGVSGTAAVTYAQAPTISTASANPSPVTGKTTQLTATATDPNNIGGLIYTWSLLTGPATVKFDSNNNTTSGNNVTATFSKAGTYTFQLTVTDSYGVSSTQMVSVTVQQTLTSVTVSPATASIRVNGSQQFKATALDQFGNPLLVQPVFTWTLVSGPGKISSSGVYTSSSTGTAVIRGQTTVGGITFSNTATVTVRRH